MIPLWVMLLLVATHVGVFMAGVYAMHLSRVVSTRPMYKPFAYTKEAEAKAKESIAQLAQERMQKQAQFSYLDSIRKGVDEDEDGIVPVRPPKKGSA